MNEQLRQKIESEFSNLVVDKQQALQTGLPLMPRFVTEFLLALARSQNNSRPISEVRDRIRTLSVDSDRKNEFISRLMREREKRLLSPILMLSLYHRPMNILVEYLSSMGISWLLAMLS